MSQETRRLHRSLCYSRGSDSQLVNYMKPRQPPYLPLAHIWATGTVAGRFIYGLGCTSALSSPPGNVNRSILPTDRATTWNPGMRAVGGIPVRSSVCYDLTPRGEGLDDTARIQAAIDACPFGQVVQLGAGTCLMNGGNFLRIRKGITLRGAGPGQTTLAKTDGAKPFREAVGAHPSPLIIVGPSRYSNILDASGVASSTDLSTEAIAGAYTVTVANPGAFSPGQIVLLDEASSGKWQNDPQGRGQVWAASDWRVIWQKHNPVVPYVDDFAVGAFPTMPGTAGSWFSRLDRPTSEIKEIASVSGTTITFTTPIHISYRLSNAAQLSRYRQAHVKNAGVEDLTLTGGDNGNLRFQWAAQSWARNVE